MMRKMIALALTAVMAIAPSVSVFADDIRVAMVTDYGDINDQSFNQTTYEACKEYCEENDVDFTYYKPEGDSTADRAAMIDMAVADGYDVVVMPGFAFAEAIVEEADMYPDVKFIALDVSQSDLDAFEDGYARDNVYSAVYQQELAGYMAGYAAVKLGFSKIGFLGGMAVPGVMGYGYGLVQGVDAAAGELGLDNVELTYAYGNQFYGDADITAAMDTWYAGGTEVVFACGGGIYTSACEAAEKVDGKVIGVDVDQKEQIDGTYGDGMCVSSALKGLSPSVKNVLAGIQAGNWADFGCKNESLGIIGEDPEENYVGLAESTEYNDEFTEDDYLALVAAMYSGDVVVSNDVEADEPSAENIKINFLGNLK
ncbi:MAG: BMP family ABC transporter substrate-binding protein [Lachnospiraceae bacterium]|nr:BMP family ABC transporter substrate-binding protein [Lachnospiraceae bacterium]